MREIASVAKPDTIIVPANGPTLTGADIVKQKDMYWALFKQFFIDFNKGFGPHDVVDAHPLKDYEAQYGDPAQFLQRRAAAYRAFYEHMPVRPILSHPNGPLMRVYDRFTFGDQSRNHEAGRCAQIGSHDTRAL